MKKKPLIVILLSIVLFLYNCAIVNGARGEGLDVNSCDYGTCTNSNIVSGACNNICWMPPYNFGMRLTVLDKNGNEVTESYDFMYTNQDFSTVRAVSGKGSKIDYLSRSLSMGDFQYGQFGSYYIASSIMSMPKFAYDASGGTLASYFKKLTSTKASAYLTKMGYNLETFYANEDYLMVEPIGVVFYEGVNYAGTVTELAHIFQNFQVNGQVGGHNFLGFSRLTHHNLPWSVYLEEAHFGKLVPAIGVCGTDVESSQITGGNGLGVGLYWTFDNAEPPDNPDCPEEYCAKLRTISNPGECSMTGTYEDPTDWCCIYKYPHLYQKEEKKYCPTFCREKVTTNFPASNLTVEAGKHFIISPVSSVEANSYCRSEIDLDTWYRDYTTNNNSIKTNYNRIKVHEKLLEAAEQIQVKHIRTEQEFTCSCPEGFFGGRSTESMAPCGQCTKEVKFFFLKKPIILQENATPIPGTEYFIYGFDGATREVGNVTRNFPGFNSNRNRNKDIAEADANREKDTRINTEKSNIRIAKSDYQASLDKRVALKAAINACQIINYEPGQAGYMALQYKYEIVESDYRTIALNATTSITPFANVRSTKTKKKYLAVNYNDIGDYKCSGAACLDSNTEPYKYPRYTLVNREYYTNTTFNIKDETYRYVLKPTDISVYSKADIPTDNLEKGLYYDIGYGNLPVHPSLAPGGYNYYVSFSSIGTSGQFTKYIKDYTYTQDQKGEPAYVCHYNVYNDIFADECMLPNPPDYCRRCADPSTCKAEGLDVIYRPIDLDDPFPAIDSTGRIPGLNWRYGGKIYQENYQNYNKTTVNYYITNNRGVTTYDVYKKEPMYEITLTPSLIKTIRSYNKQQNNEDEGYSDFELTCTNGRKCLSSFLRTNLVGHISGCGIGSWDECDNMDNHKRGD